MYVIVGKDKCPWCDKAKELLINKHTQYFDAVGDLRNFIKALGFNTVPQIWHHGVHIGGYDQLKDYLNVQASYASPYAPGDSYGDRTGV